MPKLGRAALDERRRHIRRQLEAGMDHGRGQAAQALVLLEWATPVFGAQGQHAARIDVNLWAEALRSPRVGKLARKAARARSTG